MTENEYSISYAPTNRAGCTAKKNCRYGAGSKIDKGAMRFGSGAYGVFGDDVSWSFRHPECLTSRVLTNVKNTIAGDMSKIAGYNDLSAADKKLFDDAVTNCEPIEMGKLGAPAAAAVAVAAPAAATPKKEKKDKEKKKKAKKETDTNKAGKKTDDE